MDRPEAYLNGTPATLDFPPRFVEGRTMVPCDLCPKDWGLA
ncbi:hypothetical protein [Paenibacillus oleatilyticus]